MENVQTLKNNLFDSFSEEEKDIVYFLDGNTVWLSDAAAEYAEMNTDIYYAGLSGWLRNDDDSIEYMERVIDEGLIDKNNYDFWQHVTAAQWLQVREKFDEALYNNLENIVLYLCIDGFEKESIDEEKARDYIEKYPPMEANQGIGDYINDMREYIEE